MTPLGVCLETVFTHLPYDQRVRKIAEAGFRYVEFWHPEGTWDGKGISGELPKDAPALKHACGQAGVKVTDFVLNAWDGLYGGCPVRGEDRSKYIEQVHKMIEFAKAIDCQGGITLSGTVGERLTRSQMRKNLMRALGDAIEIARKNDFVLMLEPLNTFADHPGYYLDTAAEGAKIVREFNSPHLRLLYDIYHMQIMEGNILTFIEDNSDIIAHFHCAGVPGRHEPFGGELNYRGIFRRICGLEAYRGSFGLEYFPAIPDSMESLKKSKEYLEGN